MSSDKVNKIYKAVANYISNDLKVTKEYVFTYLNERLDNFLKDWVEQNMNSWQVQRLIINQVSKIIKDGVDTGLYHRNSFDNLIRDMLKQEVSKVVSDLIEINISVKNMNKKVPIVPIMPHKNP